MPSAWALGIRGSDCLFEFLRGPERYLPARLDLDRLSGRGITAHACGSILHLKDAESTNPHAVARLEMIDQLGEHLSEHGVGLLLRQPVAFDDAGGELLQRNSGRRSRLNRSFDLPLGSSFAGRLR